MDNKGILVEGLDQTKRNRMERLVFETLKILDKSLRNYEIYKKKFALMRDSAFFTWAKRFIDDPKQQFSIIAVPYENEPRAVDIEQAAEYLGVPLEEYVYFRHMSRNGEAIKSKYPIIVGYLNLKRMQQMIYKKNAYVLDNSEVALKTGQVTGGSKGATLTKPEAFFLTALGADAALKELFTARADDYNKKDLMLRKIYSDGYVTIADFDEEDITKQKTKNTTDAYFIGMGFSTDLLTSDYKTPDTTVREKRRADRKYAVGDQ